MDGSGSGHQSGGTAYLAFLREGEWGLTRTGGSRAIAADLHQPESAIGRLPVEGTSSGPPPNATFCKRERQMRSKDLMGPDLLSEIVLLGAGMLILVSLLRFIVAAFTRT